MVFNTHEKICVSQCLWFHAFQWALFHEVALQGAYVRTCAILFVLSKERQTQDVLFYLNECEHEFQSAPTRAYSYTELCQHTNYQLNAVVSYLM